MRVLVLGGTGMLGFQLLKSGLKSDIQFFAVVRNKKLLCEKMSSFPLDNIFEIDDINNFKVLSEILDLINPEFVINAIGIIKQSNFGKNYIANIEINSLLPHKLANLCESRQIRLIHISTDCVFDGLKGGYSLKDKPNAIDLYGQSKYLGEVGYGNHITLRTSIIGHEISGNNYGLLEWFLNSQEKVKGYDKAIFSGVTTLELSKILINVVLKKNSPSGLFQAASEPINKFKLLVLIKKVYEKDIEILPSDEIIINRSLDGSRFNQIFKYEVSPWDLMIEELKAEWK
jgi:dTDP-4-dehydrorhamnose reductase